MGIIGNNTEIFVLYYLHYCSTCKHLSGITPQMWNKPAGQAQRARSYQDNSDQHNEQIGVLAPDCIIPLKMTLFVNIS